MIVPELGPPVDLTDTIKTIFSTSSLVSVHVFLPPISGHFVQEVQAVYLQQYVEYLCSQSNHQRMRNLLSLLSSLAETGIVSTRLVCEQLLCHLDLSNLLFWGEALVTVRGIVGGVDYKVRARATRLTCLCITHCSDLNPSPFPVGLPGPHEVVI